MRKLLIAAVAALALLLPVALLAGHAGAKGHDPGAFLRHAAEKLELSAAQKEQIHGVFAARHDELASQIGRYKTAHQSLIRAVHAQELDEAAVRAAARTVGEAREELAVTHARLAGELRRILTPEQLEKAHEFFSRLHEGGEGFLHHLHEHLAGKH